VLHARVTAQLDQIRPQRMLAIEVVRAIRDDQRKPLAEGGADEKTQQVPRRAVRPLQILDHQHHRPQAAEPPQRPQQQLEQPRLAKRRRFCDLHGVLAGQIRHQARQLRPTRPQRCIELGFVDLHG
jgi:hypothetical protein